MRVAVVQFPGSNCDTDAVKAVHAAGGQEAELVWHAADDLSGYDLIVLPGGFSYGDYLRAGAIARFSPVMDAVAREAERGKLVIGICNGFQILTEAGLLPGALRRNADLLFHSGWQELIVENNATAFTSQYERGERVRFPIAHGEGNYYVDEDTRRRMEASGQIAFRYAPGTNPNGSAANIAGVTNESGNVLGLMPHPERAASLLLGSTDGLRLFASALQWRKNSYAH